jgi:hypothetical protein
MNTKTRADRIDGASYYQEQSFARGLQGESSVRREALRESCVYQRMILPFLPQDKKGFIYEAATGPGILQCWLLDVGYENVYGSDFSEKEAAMASAINPDVVRADSIKDLRVRFVAATFDAILALDLSG